MSRPSKFPFVNQTPFFLCQKDKRFAYCLYVPPGYYEQASGDHTLAIVVHGSRRSAETYRDRFMDFAVAHRVVVLSPLFPLGVLEPPGSVNEDHNYKFVAYRGIRYDLILQAMIGEVRQNFTRLRDQYLLFGFSGGGQFVHRYFYLHPQALIGVSIGAPGTVTLLDDRKRWWRGTQGMEQHFGTRPDLDAMRKVRVQMIVGEQDLEQWDLSVPRDSPFWADGENEAGRDRPERLRALRDSFERHGIEVEHVVVPDVGHDGYAVLPDVKRFFASCLESPAQ